MQEFDTPRALTVDIKGSLLDRLSQWMGRQKFAPKKRAVLEAALERFLDDEEAVEKKRK